MRYDLDEADDDDDCSSSEEEFDAVEHGRWMAWMSTSSVSSSWPYGWGQQFEAGLPVGEKASATGFVRRLW